jgi:hypothetical protein
MLSVLVPMLILAVDAARVYQAYIVVSDCARNGAIYLSDPVVAGEDAYYGDYKAAALANARDLPGLTAADISSSSGTDADGNPYNAVSVSYTFSFLTAWPGLPTSFNINRTVQVRQAPVLPNFN